MVSGAVLSDDGLYRYRLWRIWGCGPVMAWIMLNPSTADAEVDDPTIRRCMGFARREGYDGIEVINLYALRTTKPKHLLDYPDPEGPGNYNHWERVITNHRTGMVVAAWGAGAALAGLPESRANNMGFLVDDCWPAMCLGRTASGAPRHPLYVKGDTPLVTLTEMVPA